MLLRVGYWWRVEFVKVGVLHLKGYKIEIEVNLTNIEIPIEGNYGIRIKLMKIWVMLLNILCTKR